MAYFGLDPTAPSFPEGKVIDAKEDPRAATRLKEVMFCFVVDVCVGPGGGRRG